MAKVKVVDKATSILYPALQEGIEIPLEGAPNDIIRLGSEEVTTFPSDFRMRNAVIDALAHKYQEKQEDYPDSENDDDERFIIGPTAIRLRCKEIETFCPYMKKAMEIIADEKIQRREHVAVHLLENDKSASNMQKFLLLTKDYLYLRYKTGKVEKYAYDYLRIGEDYIEDTIKGEMILNYSLAEEFCEFLKEFLMLRRTTISGIHERHPFTDESLEARENYLKFLTDSSVAEGKLRVESLIYLEYLARNFRISADKLVKWIEEADKNGVKEKKIQRELTNLLLLNTPTEKYYDFFMDILEIIAAQNEDISKSKILSILRRKNQVTDPAFVDCYLEAAKLRRESKEKLKQAMGVVFELNSMREGEYLEEMIRRHRYVQEFDIKMIRIGVNINE